jgi:hypothetical protein
MRHRINMLAVGLALALTGQTTETEGLGILRQRKKEEEDEQKQQEELIHDIKLHDAYTKYDRQRMGFNNIPNKTKPWNKQGSKFF